MLGVDDWALRKGQRYGAILVDLEQRRPVELLADRTAATFARWLEEHASPQVISRDRGGAYAEGARQGAPAAVQVADRFHLLSNAGDTLERVLGRHHAALREAAAAVDALRPPAAPLQIVTSEAFSAALAAPAPRTRVQQEQATRRDRRLARYAHVVALHDAGLSQVAICTQVGISRKTVRRYLRAGSFPERARPHRRPRLLTPYAPSLRERWTAGCHNAHTLWEEIRARGFTGAPALVRRYVAAWRTTPARRGRAAQQEPEPGLLGAVPAPQPTRVWSPRQARWMLLKAAGDREPDARAYCTALLDRAPEIAAAVEHLDAFGRLVRERDRSAFPGWLREAEQSSIAELRGFAAGIQRDRAAVEAALEWEWSNGQTEGQINRLKVLKRQMYGRAKLDLLRRRFLRAA